jgi:thymidylate synthase
MKTWENDYLDILETILESGVDNVDRTGVGTKSMFGFQYRVNLQDGFPATTTKKLFWKAVVSELLWFLEGSTDERRLAEIHYGKPREQLIGKTTIWTANADDQGKTLGYENDDLVKELGPIYGKQWRHFNYYDDNFAGVDQIKWLIGEIQNNPSSRRLVLTSWNPLVVDKQSLPPCHTLVQFDLHDGKLNAQLYQRSNDAFLGGFFNVASYSLLMHMIASHLDLQVGTFVHTMGNAHIYNNHIDQAKKQISRNVLKPPTLLLPKIESFDIDYIRTLEVNDFVLDKYEHHPAILAPMAV